MAEFTFRNIVQRKLFYDEVDGNLLRIQELHDETLAARDVSVSDTILYPDTTAGLAATAEGGYFVVPDTGTDELVYYREETGVAVEKVRIGARLPFGGGTLTQALNHAPAVSIASAATVAIGAAASNMITITGSVGVTGFDVAADGAIRVVTFAAAPVLTHNATSLILPGGANITTAAGDVAVMLSLGAGNWRCIAYQRASGKAVSPHTVTLNVPHTWAVAGEIKVAVANADVIPGFFVPTPSAGQTIQIVEARYKLGAGTSVTLKLQKNGVDITGYTALSVTTTTGVTQPAFVSLAAGDYIQPIVTAVSGTPQNMSLSITLQSAAPGA